MKNITIIKEKLENICAKKYCLIDSIQKCPNKQCTCAIAAETRAYMESIIPKSFINLSINDFNGRNKDGVELVSATVLKKAKTILVNFIWESETIESVKNKKSDELLISSSLNKRRDNGSNLIIYSDKNGGNSGKTMVASIIMKEVIKNRLNCKNPQSYDWIPFSVLREKLINDSKMLDRGINEDHISDIKYADWLVVDDINIDVNSSKAQKAYTNSLIESFFQERLECKLPTIFIFRFDVDKEDVEENFGVAISKIISDKSTYKISL